MRARRGRRRGRGSARWRRLRLNAKESGPIGQLAQLKYFQLNVYGRSELTEGTRNGFHDVLVTVVAGRRRAGPLVEQVPNPQFTRV